MDEHLAGPRRKHLSCPECEGWLAHTAKGRRYSPWGRVYLALGTALGMVGFGVGFFAVMPLVTEYVDQYWVTEILTVPPALLCCLPGLLVALRAGKPEVVGSCRGCGWQGPWDEVVKH